jgi:hypothetical protein
LWDSARSHSCKLPNTQNLIWLSPTSVLAVRGDRGLGLFDFNAQQDGGDCLREDRMIEVHTARTVAWPTPGQVGRVWSKLPSPSIRQETAWELSIGPYGAAAVGQTTGLLVLLSSDSWEVCAVLRVPAEYPETVIYVSALQDSFAVTHTGGRSMGGTNMFDYAGKRIVGFESHGLSSPMGILRQDVLVQLVEESQFSSSLILRMLDSKTLNLLRTAPTDLDALNGYPTLHVGKSQIAMGDGRSYQAKDLASLETLGITS